MVRLVSVVLGLPGSCIWRGMISCHLPFSDLSHIRMPYWGIFPFRMRFIDLGGVARLSSFTRCMPRWWSIRYLHDDSSVEPPESHLARPAPLGTWMPLCFSIRRYLLGLWAWFSYGSGWLGLYVWWQMIPCRLPFWPVTHLMPYWGMWIWKWSFSRISVTVSITRPRYIVFAPMTITPELFIDMSS